MDNLQNPEVEPSTYKVTYLFVGVIIFLLFAIVYLGFTFLKDSISLTEKLIPKEETVTRETVTEPSLYNEYLANIDRSEELAGSILVTTVAKDANEPIMIEGKTYPGWQSYIYDVTTNTIDPFTVANDFGYPIYLASKDGNSGQYIFISKPALANEEGVNIYNPSLFVSDGLVTTELTATEQAETNMFYRARLPQLSDDGKKFVYTIQTWSADGEAPDFNDINTWQIMIGDLESSTVTPFVYGYGGQWSESELGQFVVYLHQQGVKAKRYVEGDDHSTEKEITLVSEPNQYRMGNQISVSEDGKYLMVSYPVNPSRGNSSVDIYKLSLDKNDELTASLMHRIALVRGDSGFWPIMSPGGRYVSMQVLSSSVEGNSLQVYDMVTQEFVQKILFNDFDFESSFNTDWVSEL